MSARRPGGRSLITYPVDVAMSSSRMACCSRASCSVSGVTNRRGLKASRACCQSLNGLKGMGGIHLQIRVDAQFPEYLHQLCCTRKFLPVLTMHPAPEWGVTGARRTHERGHAHALARIRGKLHDKRA